MLGGIRLFKILGIRISIDYTWFIVFALFSWSFAVGYFPMHTPGLSKTAYILMGAISSLSLFICVLIHELSHSYTANKLGLDIKEITLFIFGGVARLTREPDNAAMELKIAIAGPIASFILAILFYGAYIIAESAMIMPFITEILKFLATINTVLLVFNMIPGFPLDGGRVLRALWWMKTGDVKKATKVGSQIGKGFAMFLIIFGFLQIVTGAIVSGLWGVLIGAFLRQAAEGSYRQLIMKLSLEGIRVGDIMTKNVMTIDENTTLITAVEKYFFNYHFVSFPVAASGARHGETVGLIALNHIRGIEREKWAATLVRDAMEKLSPEKVLNPNDSVIYALSKMVSEGVGRYPVIEKNKLVGILSRRDIMKIMEFKSELEG